MNRLIVLQHMGGLIQRFIFEAYFVVRIFIEIH